MKGILNQSGSNNCFLSCVVQVLWTNEPFKKGILELPHHSCSNGSHPSTPEMHSCVLCALTSIFLQFIHGTTEDSLSIEPLRHALSNAYQDQARFQLRQMDDAAEVYEAILESIHLALSPDSVVIDDLRTRRLHRHSPPAEKCQPECLAHKTLFLPVQECDVRGLPVVAYNKSIHYVTVSTLIQKGDEERRALAKPTVLKFDVEVVSYDNTGRVLPGSSDVIMENTVVKKKLRSHPDFGQLLGKIISGDPPRGGRGETLKPCVSKDVEGFVVGLNWPSAKSRVGDVADLLDLVCPVIDFSDVFASDVAKKSNSGKKGTKRPSSQNNGGKSSSLRADRKVSRSPVYCRPMILRGMICFYGQHYVAFVFNSDILEWTLFDDTLVKNVGPSWGDLIDRCTAGHYQPSILFYQKCDSAIAKAEKDLFDQLKRTERKKKRASSLAALIQPGDSTDDSSLVPNIRDAHIDDDEKLARNLQEEWDQEQQKRMAARRPSVPSSAEKKVTIHPSQPPASTLQPPAALVQAPTSASSSSSFPAFSPNPAQIPLLDLRASALLQQWDSEHRSGFLQGRLVTKQGPFWGIFTTRPKERIVVLCQHMLYGYSATKELNINRPSASVDVLKAHMETNEKELSWRMKDGLNVVEFQAPSKQAWDMWLCAIQDVLLRKTLEPEPLFVVEKELVKFRDGRIIDLKKDADKEFVLQLKQCPCGNSVTFRCACTAQGYCSKNCEVVHQRYHRAHCIRTDIEI